MESLRRASDEQASSLKQQLEQGEQGAAETEAKLRAQLKTMTEDLGAANSSLIEQKVKNVVCRTWMQGSIPCMRPRTDHQKMQSGTGA